MNKFLNLFLAIYTMSFLVTDVSYAYCEGLAGNAAFNCKQAILAEQIQQEQWSSYTDRERALASNIGRINYEFFQANGYLPQVTNENISSMANTIGASNDEVSFVMERMNGEYKYYAALSNVSRTLRDIDILIDSINVGGW